MNQNEVTELARQAGGGDLFVHGFVTWTNTDTPEFLMKFANLVAEKQRVKSSEVCLQVKYDPCYKVRETFAQAIRNENEKKLQTQSLVNQHQPNSPCNRWRCCV